MRVAEAAVPGSPDDPASATPSRSGRFSSLARSGPAESDGDAVPAGAAAGEAAPFPAPAAGVPLRTGAELGAWLLAFPPAESAGEAVRLVMMVEFEDLRWAGGRRPSRLSAQRVAYSVLLSSAPGCLSLAALAPVLVAPLERIASVPVCGVLPAR